AHVVCRAGRRDHRDLRPFPTRRSSDLARCAPSRRLAALVLVEGTELAPALGEVEEPLCEAVTAGGVPGDQQDGVVPGDGTEHVGDRKSTRLNSSHVKISYAVFCLKKKI